MGGSQSVTAREVAPPQVRTFFGLAALAPTAPSLGSGVLRSLEQCPPAQRCAASHPRHRCAHTQIEGTMDKQSDHIMAWRQVSPAALAAATRSLVPLSLCR